MNYGFNYIEKSKTLQVEYYDKKGTIKEVDDICIGLAVERRLIDIDTNAVYFEMSMEYADNVVVKTVPHKDITPKVLQSYSDYGFPFTFNHDVDKIAEFIIGTEGWHDAELITNCLGWKTYDEKLFFQLRKSISLDNDIHIEYAGALMVESKGTLAEYKAVLNEYVLPYTSTQAIVAFSVSSALATLLNPDYTLILHMCGSSTSGKTTMLKLAASVWGSTEINTNGIAQTWHSTANAFINSLCGYNGLTLCFDELGVSEADTNSLIYLLANGTDKKRMTVSKTPQRFSVNVCSSGEIPMKTIKGVNGTDVRLLEMTAQWTDSKSHAEGLKKALQNSYGVLGKHFVKALLALDPQKIERSLDKRTDCLMNYIADDIKSLPDNKKRIISRAIQKIAVVYLAADIIKKMMHIDFDGFEIAKFMIENSSLLDLADEPYIEFLNTYLNYLAIDHFGVKYNEITNKEIATSREYISDMYISIDKECFYSIMRKLQYRKEDIDKNLKELKKHGFLHTESGKLYNRREDLGVRTAYIELNRDKLDEEGIYYETYCWDSYPPDKYVKTYNRIAKVKSLNLPENLEDVIEEEDDDDDDDE